MEFNTAYKGNGIDFLKELEPNSVTTTFFDPQYRTVLDKLNFGNEGERQKGRALLPQMPEETILEFIKSIGEALKPSGHLFLWIDKFILCEGFQNWITGTPLHVVDLITWDKQRIGMGYRSRRRSEYLIVLQKEPKRAKDVWTLKNIPDVWDETGAWETDVPDVWKEKVARDVNFPHRKPEGLIKVLIEATSKPGDTILDPAAGSFIVMTIARLLDRKFLGCDLTTGLIPLEKQV